MVMGDAVNTGESAFPERVFGGVVLGAAAVILSGRHAELFYATL
jgi:hypothetical protein